MIRYIPRCCSGTSRAPGITLVHFSDGAPGLPGTWSPFVRGSHSSRAQRKSGRNMVRPAPRVQYRPAGDLPCGDLGKGLRDQRPVWTISEVIVPTLHWTIAPGGSLRRRDCWASRRRCSTTVGSTRRRWWLPWPCPTGIRLVILLFSSFPSTSSSWATRRRLGKPGVARAHGGVCSAQYIARLVRSSMLETLQGALRDHRPCQGPQ